MDENTKQDLSGAEEYIAAEIALTEPLTPEQEKNLRDALGEIASEAFDSFDINPTRISICYDPTRTKKEDLLRLIEQAGGKVKQVESEGSPLL